MTEPTEAQTREHDTPTEATATRPSPGNVPGDQVRSLVIDIARTLKDLHCEDVLVYDVHGLSDVTDYIVIATGTSDRQIVSVGTQVEKLANTVGLEKFGKDVDGPTTWLVLDLVEVVVHLFDPHARAFYDLEMMWGDAPKIDWRRA
ncbi:MAG: ribosome silencing factor [Phycisphaera sp.]|nr:ribosome silencing factor [Phycisphaera sp.]